MSVSHGNDPEILDGIGDALHVEADRVEGIAGTGACGMAVLVESWAGPDLEGFDADWRGAQQQLAAVAQLLRVVGSRAKGQAQQQREGSGEGGGGRGVPWLPRTSGADNTLPSPGDPALVVPIEYDTPPDSGGSDRVPHSDKDQEDLEIPIPDDGTPWTPQGLGYSDELDAYVHSMYNKDNPQEGLLAIQPADGGPVKYVRIEGNDHYGGVTVDGDNVYVTGNGERVGTDEDGKPQLEGGSYVEHYSLSDLQAASPDETVDPISRHEVTTGSTIASHDGKLYVGKYRNGEEGDIYEYELGDDGRLPSEGTSWESSNHWRAPGNMQGLVTDGEHFYVTQSHGPDDPSTLIRVDRGTQNFEHAGSLSPLSQGVVIRDDELVITSESGADPYRQDVIDSDSPWKPNLIEKPVEPEDHLQTKNLTQTNTAADVWRGIGF
ncbi:hypothetical protein ASG73_10625 [Janibacter sp. Soil728]|uniref:hypothetical protein n=1 Tax=Janibacter sp. Soil728 TaxID=1736393 RepID=UPI000700131B|nr:hypothetical protein [Janibacter sp. Soil728]KRE38031.1 hypothetical protein ASG73_10625 [Janibacter sp. Soil728]